MNILFLSRWFPYPVENGAKIRIYHLLKGLAAAHAVDLASFYADEDTQVGLAQLKEFLGEVELVQYQPFRPSSVRALAGFFSRYPRSVADTYSPAMSDAVRQLAARKTYDLVIASQIDMAPYGAELYGPVKLLEELEVTKAQTAWQCESRPLQRLRLRLAWSKLSCYVRTLLAEYDGCTVVSDVERIAIAAVTGRDAQVIPNGVDCSYYDMAPRELADRTLLYNGAITYPVNFQAVEYFLREIFPLVQAKAPDVRFIVSGRNPPDLVAQLLAGPRVAFTGFVEDIRTVLNQATLVVVPLQVGGGTRLKILEALAARLPVVSTSAGAEGLELVPGHDLFVADEPQAFAQAVITLLEDPACRERLAQHGRAMVEARYDWCSIHRQFATYLDGLMSASRDA